LPNLVQQSALKLYFITQLVTSSHGICKMGGEKFLAVKEYTFSWGKIHTTEYPMWHKFMDQQLRSYTAYTYAVQSVDVSICSPSRRCYRGAL